MFQIESAPGNLREINCESRRQRILESARRLIVKGGMRAVTMRRLARDADLSVTTLYNLIGGREKIVAALVGDAIDRMDEVLAREAPLEDPLERCRAVVTVSIEYVVQNESIFRPFALSISQDTTDKTPKASEASRHVSNRASGMQSLAIREAISQGLLIDLLDPDHLGSQIYHGWEAAFFQWGRGLVDEAGFRARALYGLYLALLGISSERVRPAIETELRSLECELGADHALPPPN
jgi:AcrR family transcriptional regulator